MRKLSILRVTLLLRICSKQILRIMKLINLLLFLTIFNLFGGNSYSQNSKYSPDMNDAPLSQQNRIVGVVSDNSGTPLPGVNVLIKGTLIGTITDGEGRFTIEAPNLNGTLEFSFIGYTTQEVPMGGRSTINVVLSETMMALEEVVVTALGIKRESKSLGYATGVVNEVALATIPSNWGTALQGKISGVNTSAALTGAAGSSRIRIRGQSSISSGDNSPLVVINGVPVSNPDYSARGNDLANPGGSLVDGGDGWLSINSDDIESITILKGAPAAALYGYRAKNGVMLITTKSGVGTKGIGVELNSNYTIENVIDETDFQYEYGQGEYGVRPTDLPSAQKTGLWSFGDPFDGVPTMQYDGVTRPYVAEKNRIKKFFETGHNFTNTLALTGGNELGNIRLSLSNTKNSGIVPKNTFKRNVVNMVVNYKFGKKLSAAASINYSNEKNDNPPMLFGERYNPVSYLYAFSNSVSMETLRNAYQDANGNEIATSRFTPRMNPYWSVNKRFQHITRDRLYGNISLRYDFTDWLYIQGRVGQDYSARSDEYNTPTGSRAIATVPIGFNGGFVEQINRIREINADFLIGANRKIGEIGIDITLGGNQMMAISDGWGTSVTNFFIRDLYTIPNGQIKDPFFSYSKMRVNSIYASAGLSYKTFLYLNVTGRNDWFSTLNPKSNSYLYPSVNGSFVVSEAIKLPDWISYAKLRGGYAEVGGATKPYQSNLYYSLNSQTHFGNVLASISGSVAPNLSLRPLKIKEAEGGIELRFFQNRIGVDLGFYNKNTVDEIVDIDVSSASGYRKSKVNIGKVNNKGFESMLTVIPFEANDMRWESNFNLTLNKSEVIDLGGQKVIQVGLGSINSTGWIAQEVGKPMGSLQGRGYARNAKGEIIYASDGRFTSDNIVKTFGSANPKWIGGWSNSFQYKNIILSANIDWKFGHKMISTTNYNLFRHGLSKASLPGREGGVIGKGVKADGVTPNDVACEAEIYYMTVGSIASFVEEFVYDASFIKFRQIALRYDVSKYLKATPVKGLVISVVCNNVLTILKHTPNIDPESSGVVSDNTAGLEQNTLPLTRGFCFMLDVKF
jgi:TonB-linked SusC/RagA family outer membrane protein